VDGHRGLGVLGRAQVGPDALAAAPPEALLGGAQEQGRVELAPAALAEDAADQAGRGDHVRDLPVLRAGGPADRGVLARHPQRVRARLGDVGVDAGDVVAHVLLQLRPGRAVHVVAEVVLALEVGLGVGRQPPLVVVHGAVAGRAAREGGEPGAPGVAQHVHDEEAVLGAHVAQPEHRPGARLAVHVRDAEAGVAHDGHVVAWRVGALGLPRLDAEARVLEVLREVLALQARRRVDEVGVHLQLVRGVPGARRVRAVGGPARGTGGQEGRHVERAREPVRARREDVQEAAAVVRAERLDEAVVGAAGQPGQLRSRGRG
jgi:hypothetical protein